MRTKVGVKTMSIVNHRPVNHHQDNGNNNSHNGTAKDTSMHSKNDFNNITNNNMVCTPINKKCVGGDDLMKNNSNGKKTVSRTPVVIKGGKMQQQQQPQKPQPTTSKSVKTLPKGTVMPTKVNKGKEQKTPSTPDNVVHTTNIVTSTGSTNASLNTANSSKVDSQTDYAKVDNGAKSTAELVTVSKAINAHIEPLPTSDVHLPSSVKSGVTEFGSSVPDTIYLCNFRVSVDGEWLCLRELQDFDLGVSLPANGRHTGVRNAQFSAKAGQGESGRALARHGQKYKRMMGGRYNGCGGGGGSGFFDDNGIFALHNYLAGRQLFGLGTDSSDTSTSSASCQRTHHSMLTAIQPHAPQKPDSGFLGVFSGICTRYTCESPISPSPRQHSSISRLLFYQFGHLLL